MQGGQDEVREHGQPGLADASIMQREQRRIRTGPGNDQGRKIIDQARRGQLAPVMHALEAAASPLDGLDRTQGLNIVTKTAFTAQQPQLGRGDVGYNVIKKEKHARCPSDLSRGRDGGRW